MVLLPFWKSQIANSWILRFLLCSPTGLAVFRNKIRKKHRHFTCVFLVFHTAEKWCLQCFLKKQKHIQLGRAVSEIRFGKNAVILPVFSLFSTRPKNCVYVLSWKRALCNAEKCKSKMQKRCRCKNTMQKNANHWSDLLFVRFFLHCCFAFFFCFCLVCFFVFFCICLGFCNFFPKSCLSSWSLVWFAFFSLSFCFLPRFFNFFRNHVCPVGPWSDLLFFLHVFAFLVFAPFRVAFFNCVFSSFFAFVLFASPASALLICMFFALFLFFSKLKIY